MGLVCFANWAVYKNQARFPLLAWLPPLCKVESCFTKRLSYFLLLFFHFSCCCEAWHADDTSIKQVCLIGSPSNVVPVGCVLFSMLWYSSFCDHHPLSFIFSLKTCAPNMHIPCFWTYMTCNVFSFISLLRMRLPCHVSLITDVNRVYVCATRAGSEGS